MSIILALETATEACSAALLRNDQIDERFALAPQQHSDIILSQVEELLTVTSISLNHVDAVAFGCGPGSFMGVRIATGVAQGLAYAVDTPVVPVSTLQALAQTVYENHREKEVLVGWDARMGAIYWGIYRLDDDGIMQSVVPDQLSKPETIKIPHSDLKIAAGNAWRVYREQLAAELKNLTLCDEIYPRAKSVAFIAAGKFARGEVVSPEQAQPIYIRDEVARPR